MTFSYNPSETTSLDQVRGKIGETDEDTSIIEDETITAVLARYPSVLGASIECLKRKIAKRSNEFDRASLGLSSSRGGIVSQLRDLLADLKSELSGDAQMFVGGVSTIANDLLESDTDFVQPKFKVGDFDNNGGGSTGTTD